MFHLLPPELRVLICNYCELSTLKSLRSSCRMFERETNSVLFHTVSLDILPQSISTLRMIANHSSLACHVQKLVVSTNLLRPCSYQPLKDNYVMRNVSALRSSKGLWDSTFSYLTHAGSLVFLIDRRFDDVIKDIVTT